MAADTAAIEQLRDELKRLRESQERLERAITKRSKRDDATAGKLDAIIDRLDAIKSAINSPSPEQLLALTVVCTSLTAIAMGGRVAYNAYQSAVQALPGQQWGEAGDTSAQASSRLPIEQQAFLDTIAQMEGADYDTLYGGSTFTDFSAHPLQCIPINVPGYEGQCSSAAGRYQFMSYTWYGEDNAPGGIPGIFEELGLQDFSPESQDKGAIALIERDAPEALPRLKRGDVLGAFCAVGKIWASLPCNSYSQNPKTGAQVLAAYEANLTTLKTAKPLGVAVDLGEDGAVTLDTSSSAPLKAGDMIGQFRVSRGTIPGEHEGVDVATPEGTPLFTIGQKGESITVVCETQTMPDGSYDGWGIYGKFYVPSLDKSFLVGHLSKCTPGTYQAGEVWGYSGNTGKSTGPHTHTEQFRGNKAGYTVMPEEPSRAFVEAIHGAL